MAVIETLPKKILDKLDVGVAVADSTVAGNTQDIYDKLDAGISVTESVVAGADINISHTLTGVQDVQPTVYTVPANKKLIVFLLYSVVKNYIDYHASLRFFNSADGEMFQIDKDYTLNANFLGGVVFSLKAGSYITHDYYTGDTLGKSTFSILGILIDA